jgi:dihydroneopterin aldolase
MTEILLEGLEFYAHHGFYAEEQSLGNRFQVDLKIRADVRKAGENDELNLTVDYVKVYALVSEQMKIRFKLLETLGQRIIQDLRQHFPQIVFMEVTISKFNPPISGLCRRVAVSSSWQA